MNIDRFQALVDRHGEDIATWPLADRGGACALLLADSAAVAVLERARSFRFAFEGAAKIRAPRDLADRIFARAFGPAADVADPPVADAATSTRSRGAAAAG